MRVEYIAEDGERFSDKDKCLKHEAEMQQKAINLFYETVARLDDALWAKYYPGMSTENAPVSASAISWLKEDICSILSDENHAFEETLEEIKSVIQKTEFSKRILEEIDLDNSLKAATIRRDFDAAFKDVNRGSMLSKILGYSFSVQDLENLAKLHKEGKHRRKIESLLTDCNFHYECGKFMNGEYDEFLKEREDMEK